MFWHNVERRLNAIFAQLSQAERRGLGTTAKSGYYRAAIILLCTVVEGLVYQLVKEHTSNSGNIIDRACEHKELCKIPKRALSARNDLCVCEKQMKDVHIDDSGVTFGKLNIYLKNKGIVTNSEYIMLDKVRIERNRVHLQGLSSSDTGYSKAKFNDMSKPLNFLIKKLK